MTKIVLLNGPPGCGKDFAGGLIAELFHALKIPHVGISVMKFAALLKERTHAAYGMPDAGPASFEHLKDTPCREFYGITPRAAYIAFSEALMKPLHGERIFGILLRDEMKGYPSHTPFVVTDSGFRPEAEVLVEHFGAGNCFLARIHRNGCSFDGDSRGWVDLEDLGVASLDVENPGTPDFKERLRPVLEWIRKP